MSKVKIVLNKEGQAISLYKSSIDLEKKDQFGYVNLQTVEDRIQPNGFITQDKRSVLIRAKVEILERYVAGGMVKPGKLQIREFVESEVPSDIKEMFFNKKLEGDEQIKQFLKKNPSTEMLLTKDGERILRFTTYDPTGLENDMFVQNDKSEVTPLVKKVVEAEEAEF